MEERFGNYILPNRNEIIGEGSYAKVYTGYHYLTHEKVAIKIIVKRPNDNPIQFLREKEIWKTLNHPNVVKLYHEEERANEFIIVMEYLKGELNSLIMRYSHCGGFPEPMARFFLCQLAAGLEYLHAKGIVHRDLKPQNLLLSSLDGNAQLKIADFGFARHEQSLMHSMLGTPLYMAPELFENKVQYTSKVDIWSAGLIFWQMLTGQQPWIQATGIDHLKHILKQKYLPDPPNASREAIKLLHKMITFEQSRMSWEQFCNCDYLKPQRGLNVSIYNHTDRWTQEIISFEHSCTHVFAVSSKDSLAKLQYQFEDVLKIPHGTLVIVETDGKIVNINQYLEDINVAQNRALFAFYSYTVDPGINLDTSYSVLVQSLDLENHVQVPEVLYLPPVTPLDRNSILDFYRSVYKNLGCYEKAACEILRMKSESESQNFQLRAWRVLTTMVLNQRNNACEVFRYFLKKFEHYKVQMEEIIKNFPAAIEKLKNTEYEFNTGKLNFCNILDLKKYQNEFEELKNHYKSCLQDEELTNRMINDPKLENIMDFALESFYHFQYPEGLGEEILEIHMDLKNKLNKPEMKLLKPKANWTLEDDEAATLYTQELLRTYNNGIKVLKELQAAMEKLILSKKHNCHLYASLLRKAKEQRINLLKVQKYFQEDKRFDDDKYCHSSISNLLHSLYTVILLPSWLEQAFKESKRRAVWKYQIKKRANRFQSHLQSLWERERATREKFCNDLSPQMSNVLGSVFAWLFSTPVQPRLEVIIQMGERLPEIPVDDSFDEDVLKLPDPILDDFEQLKQSYLLSQLQNQALMEELKGCKSVEMQMAKLKKKIRVLDEEKARLMMEKKKLIEEKMECQEKMKNVLMELDKCKDDLRNSEQICNDLLIKSVTL